MKTSKILLFLTVISLTVGCNSRPQKIDEYIEEGSERITFYITKSHPKEDIVDERNTILNYIEELENSSNFPDVGRVQGVLATKSFKSTSFSLGLSNDPSFIRNRNTILDTETKSLNRQDELSDHRSKYEKENIEIDTANAQRIKELEIRLLEEQVEAESARNQAAIAKAGAATRVYSEVEDLKGLEEADGKIDVQPQVATNTVEIQALENSVQKLQSELETLRSANAQIAKETAGEVPNFASQLVGENPAAKPGEIDQAVADGAKATDALTVGNFNLAGDLNNLKNDLVKTTPEQEIDDKIGVVQHLMNWKRNVKLDELHNLNGYTIYSFDGLLSSTPKKRTSSRGRLALRVIRDDAQSEITDALSKIPASVSTGTRATMEDAVVSSVAAKEYGRSLELYLNWLDALERRLGSVLADTISRNNQRLLSPNELALKWGLIPDFSLNACEQIKGLFAESSFVDFVDNVSTYIGEDGCNQALKVSAALAPIDVVGGPEEFVQNEEVISLLKRTISEYGSDTTDSLYHFATSFDNRDAREKLYLARAVLHKFIEENDTNRFANKSIEINPRTFFVTIKVSPIRDNISNKIDPNVIAAWRNELEARTGNSIQLKGISPIYVPQNITDFDLDKETSNFAFNIAAVGGTTAGTAGVQRVNGVEELQVALKRTPLLQGFTKYQSNGEPVFGWYLGPTFTISRVDGDNATAYAAYQQMPLSQFSSVVVQIPAWWDSIQFEYLENWMGGDESQSIDEASIHWKKTASISLSPDYQAMVDPFLGERARLPSGHVAGQSNGINAYEDGVESQFEIHGRNIWNRPKITIGGVPVLEGEQIRGLDAVRVKFRANSANNCVSLNPKIYVERKLISKYKSENVCKSQIYVHTASGTQSVGFAYIKKRTSSDSKLVIEDSATPIRAKLLTKLPPITIRGQNLYQVKQAFLGTQPFIIDYEKNHITLTLSAVVNKSTAIAHCDNPPKAATKASAEVVCNTYLTLIGNGINKNTGVVQIKP